MLTKHQREVLSSMRARGFVIDAMRTGKGSHLVIRYTSPTGSKGVIPIAKNCGDWRGIRNLQTQLKRHL